MPLQKVHPEYIDGSAASNGQALVYNGTNVVWGTATVDLTGYVTDIDLAANLISYVTNTDFVSNLVNYQTVAGLAPNVQTLSANNANNLGGVAANVYVTSNGDYTITGVYTHTANVGLSGVLANGSIGLAGQALLSNGSSTYWGTAGVNTDAQYTWANQQTFSNNILINGVSANGSLGTDGQVLTSNGTDTYWSTLPAANSGLVANSSGWFVLANTGIIANSSGTFVDGSIYPNTAQLAANVSTAYANAVLYTDNKIANLVNSAPAVLDTLSELANALGNDANFATTVTNGIANAYTNAVAVANTNAVALAGNAYSNAVTYVTSQSFVNTAQLTANLAGYAKLSGDVFTGNVTLAGVVANGSIGTAGQVLASNGSATYWSTSTNGTVTNVATGNGMVGGPITSTGTVSVLANTGIIANASGVFVDGSIYPNTAQLAANAAAAYANAVADANTNAVALAGNAYSNAIAYSGNAAQAYANAILVANTLASTAYANAVADANTNATTLASNAYANAVLAANTLASTAYTNAVSVANTNATTLASNAYANAVADANTNATTLASNAYANAINYSYANTQAFVASQSFVNTAQLAANLVAYAKSVNGINPDAAGNIPVSLTEVLTGNIFNKPTTSNNGIIYVVSGDPDTTINGDAYISNGTVWSRISGADTAANDARYLQLVGMLSNVATAHANSATYVLANNGIVSNSSGVFVNANTGLVANSDGLFLDTTAIVSPSQLSSNLANYPNNTQLSANLAGYAKLSGDVFTGNVTLVGVIANGSIGTAGQILASNGSATYWTAAGGSGTVTNIATGNGMVGGPVTSTGTVSVLANTGIIANSSGVFVDSSIYPNTAQLTANAAAAYANAIADANTNAVALAGNAYSNAIAYSGNAAAAYANAVSDANTNATTLASNAYSNAVVVANTLASTAYANAVADANTNATTLASNAYANAVSYVGAQSFVNTSQLSANLAGYAKLSGDVFTGNVTLVGVIANGTIGTAGQILASNGSATYWTTAGGSGTVTNVASGNGLTGGPITGTGTLSVLANTGIISNSSGVFVDSSIYPNTAQLAANAAAAYANAVADANTNATTLASNAYANAVAVANTNAVALAGNAYSNAVAMIAVSTANNANYFGGLAANGGTAGQVLTSNGTSAPYWAAAGGTGTVTNVATGNGLTGGPVTTTGTISVLANNGLVSNSTGIFINSNTGIIANSTGTFVDNTVFAALSGAVFTGNITSNGIVANGSIGTAGQVLASNGSSTYWTTVSAGVNADATYAWTNTHSFSNTVTLNAISANGSLGTAGQVLTSNGTDSYWSSMPVANTGLIANATGWHVLANTGVIANTTGVYVDNTVFAALSGAVFTGNVTLAGVIANGSIGTAGQVLTSNGSATYWTTAAAGVNVDATYAWTNTHSFSNTVTLNAVNANGTLGTAGQVLTSNGTDTYWSTVGGITFTNAASAPATSKLGDEWYDTTNDILYIRVNDGSANLWMDVSTTPSTFSNLAITGGIQANGSFGTSGQVLTTNGTASYWSTVASSAAGTNTQIYFNDSGVTNAVAAYTFNKSTNNVYIANSIGINVATPLAKVDVSGTAAHNIVAMGTGTNMDLSQGQVFSRTNTGAVTLAFTNVPAGRAVTVVLHLTNGGSGTVTWPASVKWPGGTAPTLTNPGVDVLVFNTPDGGTTWRGNIFGKDIK